MAAAHRTPHWSHRRALAVSSWLVQILRFPLSSWQQQRKQQPQAPPLCALVTAMGTTWTNLCLLTGACGIEGSHPEPPPADQNSSHSKTGLGHRALCCRPVGASLCGQSSHHVTAGLGFRPLLGFVPPVQNAILSTGSKQHVPQHRLRALGPCCEPKEVEAANLKAMLCSTDCPADTRRGTQPTQAAQSQHSLVVAGS